MSIRVKNTCSDVIRIAVLTRDMIELEPGEEIEIEGDIELFEKIFSKLRSHSKYR